MRAYLCEDLEKMNMMINGRIDNHYATTTVCCEGLKDVPAMGLTGDPMSNLVLFMGLRQAMLAEGINRATGAMNENGAKFTKGCASCRLYECKDWNPAMQISLVNLSCYPSPCQCRCVYCGAPKQWVNSPEVKKAYDEFFTTVEVGRACGVIAPDASYSVACGEITIHPFRERILELVRGHKTTFATNCFLFDQDIGDHLHDNEKSTIYFSIDAGTPGSWKKVKGFDNFETVTSNLVKYRACCVRPEQIKLKYIILPDLNDTYEDFVSLIEIMKVLGVHELAISRNGMYTYTLSRENRKKLTGAAAYLIAMLQKNGFTYNMNLFLQEEESEANSLANEILRKGMV